MTAQQGKEQQVDAAPHTGCRRCFGGVNLHLNGKGDSCQLMLVLHCVWFVVVGKPKYADQKSDCRLGVLSHAVTMPTLCLPRGPGAVTLEI